MSWMVTLLDCLDYCQEPLLSPRRLETGLVSPLPASGTVASGGHSVNMEGW